MPKCNGAEEGQSLSLGRGVAQSGHCEQSAEEASLRNYRWPGTS